MDRLNYFNPYRSKSDHHEDQLTWAYMMLLKHSFHAFALFFDYCKSNHLSSADESPLALHELLEQGWEIDTQKGNPSISTNRLLSVLITDASINREDGSIQASDRNARYDGVITFGDLLTMIIEVKPRSSNVWFGQLDPSKEGLSEDTKVYSNAAHLQWKEIIRQLGNVLDTPTIAGAEKMLIGDFLSYIDHHFPYLNPFDGFHLCKGNQELIYRRIQSLLRSVVNEEDLVKYHNAWGYYIESPYKEIRKIGLICETKANEWRLELSFFFGDTQSQSRAFYTTGPTLDHLSDRWYHRPNFHVSFASDNLVWFRKDSDPLKYLQFWKENVDSIYQVPRAEVPEYIQWVKDEGVVIVTEEENEEMRIQFYKTERQTLNICPGFGAIYEIESEEAEQLDRKKELRQLIHAAIKEGCQIIGKDGSEFLRENL